VAFLVCAGLACGSPSPGSSGKDGGGTGGTGVSDARADSPQSVRDGESADRRDVASGSGGFRGTGGSGGSDARTTEMCPVGVAQYDAATYADARCVSSDDTDRDGLLDCLDACPSDPAKVVRGVCGCGVPDVDSDGDGVPDCFDQCPLDPNNNVDRGCGCLGHPGLVAAGTPCGDPACPQPGATCDGAGVCGNRSACSPCPGGRYLVSTGASRQYWFCAAIFPAVTGPGCLPEDAGTGGGAMTRAAAQSACQAKGLTLARIDAPSDNSFMVPLLTAPLWIGANDLQTAGEWYWPSSTSDSDKLMWSGGADGSQQSSAFSTWAPGAPGANRCATIRTDGRWVDTDCGEMHGYICQYQLL